MAEERLDRERRTLGTTAGGSTYMITLPKRWIEDLQLQKGEEVSLVRVETGIYVSPDRDRETPKARTTLKVDGPLRNSALSRALISQYVAGHDIIEVTGTIDNEQREIVRDTVQRLIGAEILQETADFMLIQTLRDPQVLSAPQLLAYIRENAEAMVTDAPLALLEGDLERAQGVIQRDERVDRFFLLLSRQLYAALRDPLAEVERGVSRVEFFNTHTVARQLERIADHAVKIAQSAEALILEDRVVPSDVADDLHSTEGLVRELLDQVMGAFLDLDVAKAQKALITLPDIEDAISQIDRELLDLDDTHLAFHLGIVVDSIGRVKDYAANVAELALNAEALQ